MPNPPERAPTLPADLRKAFDRNPAEDEALEDDCTDWDPYDIEGWEEGIGHG